MNGNSARLKEHHSSRRDAATAHPLLTVIIPAYNESRTLGELIKRVMAAPFAKEIIIVNDASTDATGQVLDEFRTHPNVLVFTHPTNLGKGRAIRTALEHASGGFAIIQDADLEYDPQDYARVLAPLLC